jgi:hypothetical protein
MSGSRCFKRDPKRRQPNPRRVIGTILAGSHQFERSHEFILNFSLLIITVYYSHLMSYLIMLDDWNQEFRLGNKDISIKFNMIKTVIILDFEQLTIVY